MPSPEEIDTGIDQVMWEWWVEETEERIRELQDYMGVCRENPSMRETIRSYEDEIERLQLQLVQHG